MAGHFPSRPGDPSPEPSDPVERPQRPRNHTRAGHPHTEQLRLPEAEWFGYLLLYPENRNAPGSITRRQAAKGTGGGNRRAPGRDQNRDAERARPIYR